MDRPIKKILITGGAGYIGHNLQKHLSADWFDYKYEVTICDFNYKDVPLAEQLGPEDVEPFDGIVHLAALSGIIPCQQEPEKAIRRNLLTAYNVFREASRLRIPVIFTSSQAAKTPDTSSYALQKRTCELMADQFNAKGALITVFRMTNVYGGELYLEKKNTVIKKFIEAYGDGKPLQIHGDGEQLRDFLNVEDVCVFIERALNNPWTESPIDVGTGIGTSIADIAKIFQDYRKRKDGTLYPVELEETSRTIGVESSIADPSLATDIWGYEARPKMGEYITQQIYLQEEKAK